MLKTIAKRNGLQTLQDCMDRVRANGKPIAVGRRGAYSVRVCTPGNASCSRKQYYRVHWASTDGRSNTFNVERGNHPALSDKTHERIPEMIAERLNANRN